MSKFSKGLVFGSIVGAACGLFFAPRSGKATRQHFIDELDDWTAVKNDFTEKLTTFKESAEHFQDTAATYIPPFIEGIQKDTENFKFQAEPRVAQINEQLEKINAELPKAPEE